MFLRLVFICSFFCFKPSFGQKEIELKKYNLLLDITSVYEHLRFYNGNDINSENWDKYLVWSINEVLSSDCAEDYNIILNELISPTTSSGIINNEKDIKGIVNNKKEKYYKFHHGPGLVSDNGFLEKIFVPYNSTFIKISPKENIETSVSISLSRGFFFHYSILGKKNHSFFKRNKEIKKIKIDRKIDNVKNLSYILASLIKVWSAYETFYPQFIHLGLAKDIELKDILKKALSVNDIPSYYLLLEDLLSLFKDGHSLIGNNFGNGIISRYYSFRYLPFEVSINSQNKVFISSTNSSCLDLSIGDEIISINHANIDTFLKELINKVSASTPQEVLRKLEARFVLRMKRDSVNLKVKKNDGTLYSVSLMPVFNYSKNQTIIDSTSYYFSLHEDVLYLNMDATLMTYSKFKSKQNELENTKYVVFDLRERPTYDFEKIMSHFVTDTVYSDELCIRDSYYPNNYYVNNCDRNKIIPHKLQFHPKLYFLINRNTYSYGETCLSYVKNGELGTIIGEPTSGTNGNTIRMDLPILSVFMTGMKVINPKGEDIWFKGIQPNVYIPTTNTSALLVNETLKIIKKEASKSCN